MGVKEATLLRKILQTKQGQYATSLAEDIQLLQSLSPPQSPASLEGSSRRLKMALQVRMGEKEIFQAVQALLDPIVAA